MFGFRRKRTQRSPRKAAPAAAVATIPPVTDPDATLSAMADAFEAGDVRAAARRADSLLGWMLHGGCTPIGFQRETVMKMIGIVLAEAGKGTAPRARRTTLQPAARVDPNRPSRPDILASLCQEIRRLGDQAKGVGELDFIIVLDALAGAATEGKLREFAMAVGQLKTDLELP